MPNEPEQGEQVKFIRNARDRRTGASYHAGDTVEVDAEAAARFREAGVIEGSEEQGPGAEQPGAQVGESAPVHPTKIPQEAQPVEQSSAPGHPRASKPQPQTPGTDQQGGGAEDAQA